MVRFMGTIGIIAIARPIFLIYAGQRLSAPARDIDKLAHAIE
jgi:hypothetical protein